LGLAFGGDRRAGRQAGFLQGGFHENLHVIAGFVGARGKYPLSPRLGFGGGGGRLKLLEQNAVGRILIVEIKDAMLRGGEDDFFEGNALGGFGQFAERSDAGRI
jgi:hypothetical protein